MESFNDAQPHVEWIAYLHETLIAHSSQTDIIFSTLESLLAKPYHLNTNSCYLVAYFQFLNLGFRTLQEAVNNSTKGLTAPSIMRRRVLRERIIYCACQWFARSQISPATNIQKIEEEYTVLYDFLQLLINDSKIWNLEYKDKFHVSQVVANENVSGTDIDGTQTFGRMRHSAGYVHGILSKRENDGDDVTIQVIN
jgi:hypothetical protein